LAQAASHFFVEGDPMLEQIEVGPILVAGNCSANIEVISEKGPFRAQNMIVSEKIARDFFITDIKVGRNSQFVSASAVHASFFARRGMADDLLFDYLSRGMKMTVSVHNMSFEAKTFHAVLKGSLIAENQSMDCVFTRIPIGLGHTIVPANGKGKVSVQLQVVCRALDIVIPTYILDALKVTSVRVVGVEKLTEKGLTDGEAAFAPGLMQIGDWLCVEVENLSDQPRAFYGTVGGALVR
jgi:hypothetical protein